MAGDAGSGHYPTNNLECIHRSMLVSARSRPIRIDGDEGGVSLSSNTDPMMGARDGHGGWNADRR